MSLAASGRLQVFNIRRGPHVTQWQCDTTAVNVNTCRASPCTDPFLVDKVWQSIMENVFAKFELNRTKNGENYQNCMRRQMTLLSDLTKISALYFAMGISSCHYECGWKFSAWPDYKYGLWRLTTRGPPIGWAKQNATALKIDPKLFKTTFSVVFELQ